MAKKNTAQELNLESHPGAPWRDLSDLLRRERELHAILKKRLDQQRQAIERFSKRQFRLFLDSIPLLIVQVGTDQRVVFCNKSFAAFVGLTRPQTIGKHFWEVLPTDYEAFRPHLLAALQNRKITFEQSL